ncbi:MAG: SGNH/GDSL hydrolase family protein [Anaerolineales bacterium]
MRFVSINLGLLSGGVLLALFLLELITRIFHLGTGGFWEPDPYLGWRNIPHARGWESCYGECTVYVEINSHGLRDREIDYQKKPDQKRVLLLGDSITAGMQVPLEKTFAKILEQRLNRDEDVLKWEVVNAAVNAYGTDNELIFYRQEGVKYQPDIVILSVYLANDVYNNSRELEVRTGGREDKPYFRLDDQGELVLENYPVQGRDSLGVVVGSFIKRYFQLPRFIAQILNLRREVPPVLQPIVNWFSGKQGESTEKTGGQQRKERDDICSVKYTETIQDAWDITKALISQMRDEVEESGANFAVLIVPASPQLVPPSNNTDWYCEQPNIELENFLKREDIAFLDLLYSFRQHILDGGEQLYYQRDFHMNEDGHQLAGELLYEFFTAAYFEMRD